MLIALVLLALLPSVIILAQTVNTGLTPNRRLLRRRVVVNLKSGSAISGVLYAQRGPLLVLRNATLHEAGQQVPVDGEAVVERSQVDWIQSPTPRES